MARHAHATKELKREVEAHLRRGEGGCTAQDVWWRRGKGRGRVGFVGGYAAGVRVVP